MRWRTWLSIAGVLMTAAVGAEPKVARTAGKNVKLPADPYTQGVREAEAEWRKGDVTCDTYGLQRRGVRVDEEYGLPYQAVAGCVAGPDLVERVRGHAERVRQLIAQRGLPPGNRLAWLPQILDPIKYWRSLDRAPQALRFDRKEVVSPDGSFRLRLKPVPQRELPPLLAAKNGAPFSVNLFHVDRNQPQVEVQWGPEKSDLYQKPVAKSGS